MIGTKVIQIFEWTKQFLNIFINMEHKKNWMKYIDTLGVDNELAETYYNLRKAFKREGWTEEDLKSPPYYPNDIMRNFQKFSDLRNEVFFEIKSFFGDVDHNEFSDYLMNKLKIIDLKTPLNNGNIKRNNSGDEDY